MVSRSGYYAWIKRKPSKRAVENQELMEQIREIYKKSKGTYGSPRITEELKINHVHVSRPRVARLMKKANIRSIIKKKFVATTNSKHSFPISPNLLNRKFKVDRQGKVWVSDITYIRTLEGWLYLTVIMDLADRKIIGWALSSSLKASDTVIPAWRMAICNRAFDTKLIFHSDRGVQYACTEFRMLISADPKVCQSMSRKGDCWDNAVAESFFHTLKIELVHHCDYKTRIDARTSIFEYIEVFYNRQRSHSVNGYEAPLVYESMQKVA